MHQFRNAPQCCKLDIKSILWPVSFFLSDVIGSFGSEAFTHYILRGHRLTSKECSFITDYAQAWTNDNYWWSVWTLLHVKLSLEASIIFHTKTCYMMSLEASVIFHRKTHKSHNQLTHCCAANCCEKFSVGGPVCLKGLHTKMQREGWTNEQCKSYRGAIR